MFSVGNDNKVLMKTLDEVVNKLLEFLKEDFLEKLVHQVTAESACRAGSTMLP